MPLLLLYLHRFFFLPQTIADIVHNKDDIFFVAVPDENFTVFAIGYGFICLASLILFLFNIRKLSIAISILCLILAFCIFYIGSQYYQTLAASTISYSPLFTLKKETYSWDEVTQIIHYRSENGEISEYKFVFADGNQMKINDNPYFQHVSYKFSKKLHEEGLTVELILIESK